MSQTKKTRRSNQCGNCYDGKLLMPGEMCGTCGNSEPKTRRKRRKIVRRTKVEPPPASPGDLQAFTGRDGSMNLRKLATGGLWLTNGAGEGMEIKDGDPKFQACLREFFNANF